MKLKKTWTTQRDNNLRGLWAAGYKMKEIAHIMKTTPRSITSRVMIIGLKRYKTSSYEGQRYISNRNIFLSHKDFREPKEFLETTDNPIDLGDTNAIHCRFPFGSILDGTYHCCGEMIFFQSYCEKHHNICYNTKPRSLACS